MASMNLFDLLGDDAEDPSQQIVAEQLKVVTAPPPKKQPPALIVRDSRNDTSRGTGRGRGRGGRGEASEDGYSRRPYERRSGNGRG